MAKRENRVLSSGFQEARKEVGVEEKQGEVEEKRLVTNSEGLFAFILGSHGHRLGHHRPLRGGLEVGKHPLFSKQVGDAASWRGTGTHGWRRQHS